MSLFSRVSKSGFLGAHIFVITHLNVNGYQYYIFYNLTLCIWETPANSEYPDEILNFIRVYTVCKGKIFSDKRIKHFFLNYNLTP